MLSLLLAGGCSPKDDLCFTPKNVYLQIGFQVIDTMFLTDVQGRDSIVVQVRDTGLNYPSMLSLGVDSPVLFQGTKLAFGLETLLDPSKPQLTFQFQADSSNPLTEMVTVFYQPYEHFISNACGYTFNYRIDSVQSTFNDLDSIHILNRDVTLDAQKKHLQFYFID